MADKRKRGGQPGNKNAVGNRGGGAPLGNKNALKDTPFHRLMRHEKYLDHLCRNMLKSDLLLHKKKLAEAKLSNGR
jgi:uncharacterized protein YjcR